MFVDSHAHLDMEQFDADRDEIVRRAVDADVSQVVTVGIDVDSSLKAIALADIYSPLFAAVGIHPHNADAAGVQDLKRIESLSSREKVVAIGEIGLDFYRNLSSKDKQRKRFMQQLAIAGRCGLPAIIHARESYEEVLDVLSSFNTSSLTGVIHCFSGTIDFAQEFIKMNFFISISGTVTFSKENRLHEVAARIPLDKMLLETDSPFLSPVPYRGRRNEPCRVIHTAQKVADIRGISFEEIGVQTSKNTRQLFGLPVP
ncbi:MAG: TatD family hydrolase [Thermodesulfobacteriota bacterium]